MQDICLLAAVLIGRHKKSILYGLNVRNIIIQAAFLVGDKFNIIIADA